MAQTPTMLGQSIATLNFTTGSESLARFDDLKGRNLVLYFYPKDSTSGCTQEGIDFRDLYPQFQQLNADIYGISRDSLKSHEKFKCKYEFPFELISDPEQTLCDHFKVMKEKSMYGRHYLGIERSTFLIDSLGIIRQEWRNVKVPNHAQEVLRVLETLVKAN